MSFMAPVPAQGSKPPIVPDLSGRSEHQPGVPDGLPFRQELQRALGLPPKATKATQPDGASADGTTSAPERLDPLGAARRALLGGEPQSTATETLPEAATPVAPTDEPQSQSDPSATVETLVAAAVAAIAVPARAAVSVVTPTEGTQTAPNLAPVESHTDPARITAQVGLDPTLIMPQPTPESVDPSASLPMISPALQGEVITEGAQPRALRATAPEDGKAKVDQSTVDQRPAGQSGRPVSERPTFAALVELITTTQAQDGAQTIKPVQTTQQGAVRAESVLKQPLAPAQAVAASPAEDGDSVVHTLELSKAGPVATPHPTPLEIPARTAPLPAPAILNQVARSIRVLAEGARSELQVKLHPAELGEILVRLTIQDGVLQAQLHTTDAAVKATLDANLDALKARFEQHGLHVSSLAVSTGAGQLTDDGQAKGGWTQQSARQQRRGSGPDSEGEEVDSQPEQNPTRRILGRRPSGRLDHLA
jgi:flagellar hook-length control protein FliK